MFHIISKLCPYFGSFRTILFQLDGLGVDKKKIENIHKMLEGIPTKQSGLLLR